MKAYRCVFCGDVYMGNESPSFCPYCGAPDRYIVPIAEWRAPELPELGVISRANLERAAQLEVNNTQFYRNAGNSVSIDSKWQGIFKYLARMENEHAGTIRKALGVAELPPPNEDVSAKADLAANIVEVLRREEGAGKFYSEALAQAAEARVRQIFAILIEVEAEHLKLGQTYLEY
jgi:rubrerythrin